MRDAMIAAITLNVFMAHCDRVVMANLAQTVNVLQSVILTEGDKMVLTPTYHVFDLYRAHQGGRQLDCFVQTDEVGEGDWHMPRVIASASEKDGVTTLTVANLSEHEDAAFAIHGLNLTGARGRILHGDFHAYNDFASAPLSVQPFTGIDGNVLRLPACSVVEITVG